MRCDVEWNALETWIENAALDLTLAHRAFNFDIHSVPVHTTICCYTHYKMMKSLIFAACAAAVAASSAPPPNVGKIFYLTDAAKNQGAVCLDGSPAAYYYAPGIESTKFYIHQQGGGWCTSDDDCFGRSKTNLGSSKNYSQTLNFGGGYFSNDPVQNPLMWNFTRIYLPYCE